jgi:hypothetical protein
LQQQERLDVQDLSEMWLTKKEMQLQTDTDESPAQQTRRQVEDLS